MPYEINKAELARRRRDKISMSRDVRKSLSQKSFHPYSSFTKPQELIGHLDEHAEKHTLNASQMVYLSEYMERAYRKTATYIILTFLVVFTVFSGIAIFNVAETTDRYGLFFLIGCMGFTIVICSLIAFYLAKNPARSHIDMVLRNEYVAYKIPVERKMYRVERTYGRSSVKYEFLYIVTKAGTFSVASMEEFNSLLTGEDAVVIVFNKEPQYFFKPIPFVRYYGMGVLNGELLTQK